MAAASRSQSPSQPPSRPKPKTEPQSSRPPSLRKPESRRAPRGSPHRAPSPQTRPSRTWHRRHPSPPLRPRRRHRRPPCVPPAQLVSLGARRPPGWSGAARPATRAPVARAGVGRPSIPSSLRGRLPLGTAAPASVTAGGLAGRIALAGEAPGEHPVTLAAGGSAGAAATGATGDAAWTACPRPATSSPSAARATAANGPGDGHFARGQRADRQRRGCNNQQGVVRGRGDGRNGGRTRRLLRGELLQRRVRRRRLRRRV